MTTAAQPRPHRAGGPVLARRLAWALALGLLIGWATDYAHVGIVAYAPARGVLGVPYWAHLQYAAAGAIFALFLAYVEPRLKRHPSTRPAALLADLAGFLAVYYAPVWCGPWAPLLMALILLARLTLLSTPPDLLLAPLGAIPATLAEWGWTQAGYYHYLAAGWSSVPAWLLLVWAYATVAIRRYCLLLPGLPPDA